MQQELTSLDVFGYYSNNFPDFCRDVLGLSLSNHHLEMIDLTLKNRFVCYMAARGLGKTELWSVAYPIWLAFRSIKPFDMIIASGSEKQCKNIIRRIQTYCHTIPIVREKLVPDNLHSSIWSATQLETKNECFIQAFPITSASIRGNHVNFAIADDIYSDDGADLESVNDSFDYAFRPIINLKKGQLIIIGTPFGEKDIFTRIKENKEETGFVYREYPAVITNKYGEWEKSQWPEFLPLDELRKIKASMTSVSWSREYMLDYISDGQRLYPESLVKFATESGLEHRPLNKRANYYMGCDIAISDSERADYSVFITLEKEPNCPAKQVNLVRIKGCSTDKQLEIIRNLYLRFRHSRILIENNGLSMGLVDLAKKDEVLGSVIDTITTTVSNKEEILGKLEIAMRNGLLKISDNEVLHDELSKFGVRIKKGRQVFEGLGKHDDTVMSLAFAYEALNRGAVFSYAFI